MLDNRIEQTNILKRKFQRSWNAFFKYFGKPNDLQISAIPEIALGKNVIIHSPAASGKTECILVPFIEDICREKKDGLKLLYITPTRALVNNIYRRIIGPLTEVGLSVSIKTADHPSFNFKKPSDILITTPESFDSLICRHKEVFVNLKKIIIDEVHLIDSTYRGDQLRILLKRLEFLYPQLKIQYGALSATLNNPEEVASRYFSSPHVITFNKEKIIELEIVESLSEAIDFIKKKKLLKAILFANSRADVERLASELKAFWPKDKIFIHHGSLSKNAREEAEKCLIENKWGICVATMTLEIGIDVGDVDVVLLFGAPPEPSSFLQRVGRGSRTLDTLYAVGIAKDDTEKNVFKYYEQCFKSGNVEKEEYTIDKSVCVQQIFSIVYSNRSGISETEIIKILSSFYDKDDIVKILTNLISKKFIIFKFLKYFPAEQLLNIGDRGLIHSNISSQKEVSIVNERNGQNMGSLSIVPIQGAPVIIKGEAWEIRKITAKEIWVKKLSGNIGDVHFRGRNSKGFFSYLLP